MARFKSAIAAVTLALTPTAFAQTPQQAAPAENKPPFKMVDCKAEPVLAQGISIPKDFKGQGAPPGEIEHFLKCGDDNYPLKDAPVIGMFGKGRTTNELFTLTIAAVGKEGSCTNTLSFSMLTVGPSTGVLVASNMMYAATMKEVGKPPLVVGPVTAVDKLPTQAADCGAVVDKAGGDAAEYLLDIIEAGMSKALPPAKSPVPEYKI